MVTCTYVTTCTHTITCTCTMHIRNNMYIYGHMYTCTRSLYNIYSSPLLFPGTRLSITLCQLRKLIGSVLIVLVIAMHVGNTRLPRQWCIKCVYVTVSINGIQRRHRVTSHQSSNPIGLPSALKRFGATSN